MKARNQQGKIVSAASVIVDGLCAFEALRRCGVASEDIYFLAQELDGHLAERLGAVAGCVEIMVVAKQEEPKASFNISVGVTCRPQPREALHTLWLEKSAAWNRATPNDYAGLPGFPPDLFERSWIRPRVVELVPALMLKGFVPSKPGGTS